MNSWIRKSWLALSLVFVAGVSAVEMKAQSRLLVTTRNGVKYEFEIGAGRKVVLPLRVKDAATGATLKLGVRDVVTIVTAEGSPAVDGVTRWEVQRVATPSLIQGKRNTELLLLEVVAGSAAGTVYRWVRTTVRNGVAHFGLWYGVKPEGAERVYPFVQDGKVWFRDMKMVLGDSCPSFVAAATAKYMKGKGHLDRQKRLKEHPADILELQAK